MILSMASFQILLKFAAIHSIQGLGVVHSVVLNPWLFAAFSASLIGIFFWLLTLRKMPLSAAYPWTSVIYFIVPLAGAWFFSDILSLRYMVGLFFVLLGVLLTVRAN
jgi:multidrug transporter EmrE-like cation transporter